MILLIAQTTLPATTQVAANSSGLTAAEATLVSALIIFAGTISVALLNWRYLSIATRYKSYLEAYKLAKETGLASVADEEWARRLVKLIAKDVPADEVWTHKVHRTWMTASIALSGIVIGLKMLDVKNQYPYQAVQVIFIIMQVAMFGMLFVTTWLLIRDYFDLDRQQGQPNRKQIAAAAKLKQEAAADAARKALEDRIQRP